MAAMQIHSAFDGGNARVLSLASNDDGSVTAKVEIVKDPFTEGTDKKQHSQWFYFCASNVKGLRCRFHVVNVNDCSYAPAWKGTWAVVSEDRQQWTRAKTTYNHEKENGELIIHAEPSTDRIWVAYFAPFTVEQHYELVSWCGQQKDLEDTPLASIQTLTSTLDGRPLDMVVSGTGSAKCYFIARQHPGESMAEWWMKGFLQRLLDPRDSVARKLRAAATFFIVPNMNPDGSFRGHLRTNASGANLNREWGNTADYLAPSQERSPEVFAVMKNLEKTGCDLFVDVHGDEELPHIFFAGTQGIPNWSDRLCELLRIFTNAQLKASPEFQIGHGYDNDESCKANLAVCGDSVASKYDCLAVTLEMPFKDTLGEHQCQTEGWSPDRCIRFGATMLDAVSEVLPFLRKEFPFNNGGIGDGLEIPGPFQLGYKNPPSGEAFDTTA